VSGRSFGRTSYATIGDTETASKINRLILYYSLKRLIKMERVKCTNCETENPINYRYCTSCGYELPKFSTEILDNTIERPVREKTGKGKIIAGLIGFAIFFVFAFFAAQYIFDKPPLVDKTMMKIASEINKSCPMMIDAETRLDNAVALPGNVFQYNYTLVHIEKATADPEEMRNLMLPTITNQVKTNPDMKFMRDRQTTVNYYYKDKAGIFFLKISVTPDKYE